MGLIPPIYRAEVKNARAPLLCLGRSHLSNPTTSNHQGLDSDGHGDPVQFATAKQLDRPDRNGCTSYGFANWGPTHAGKAIEQSPATKGRAGGARFQFTPTARPTRPSQASSVGLAINSTIPIDAPIHASPPHRPNPMPGALDKCPWGLRETSPDPHHFCSS